MQYRGLYAAVLIGLTLLMFAALGNGLISRPLDYSDWQYRALRSLCHQIPGRSLTINGVPMAVNARCFGIFTGLWAGWILIPLMAQIPAFTAAYYQKSRPGGILLLALILQIIDYSAGYLSIWNSSNFSRFFLGIFFGTAIIWTMMDQFIKTRTQQS